MKSLQLLPQVAVFGQLLIEASQGLERIGTICKLQNNIIQSCKDVTYSDICAIV